MKAVRETNMTQVNPHASRTVQSINERRKLLVEEAMMFAIASSNTLFRQTCVSLAYGSIGGAYEGNSVSARQTCKTTFQAEGKGRGIGTTETL